MQNPIMGFNNRILLKFCAYSIAIIFVAIFLLFINKITRFIANKDNFTITYQKIDLLEPVAPKPENKPKTEIIKENSKNVLEANTVKLQASQNIIKTNSEIITSSVIPSKNIAKFNSVIYSPKVLEDAILKTPQISNKSLAVIHALECERVDIKERPKDCPPSSTARKIIEEAQKPKYTGQFTKGQTNAEINAKRYAGWRDKCETNSGEKATICIPFGKKPYRIKTPYELCIEKGLGGCTRPPMPDGTQSKALNYGNE